MWNGFRRLGSSVSDAWQFIVRWWLGPVLFALGLWGIVGGSNFGFNPRAVAGPVILVLVATVSSLFSYQTVRSKPSQLRSVVVFSCLVAGLFGFLLSSQTQCLRGVSGGSDPECFESEDLRPDEA